MNKKFALYIGRWQNFHKGHEWLLNQQLEKGKNVWIAIRDVEVDENNPKTAEEIFKELYNHPFIIENFKRVKISIISDIESINYGRDVGYEVIQHTPPDDIKQISGTKIRNYGWKSTIDIDRKEAERLVFARLADIHDMSDSDLGNLLENMGYGDDTNLPYFGHNFFVVDKIKKDE